MPLRKEFLINNKIICVFGARPNFMKMAPIIKSLIKKDVEVIIDNNTIKFFPDEDSAWAENDSKVILSMKKGLELIVKGYSSRGTLTKDTYTLKGFTAAYNNLFDDC